ncbi:MAG: hypothetical protein ACK2TU_04830 [Anaerolineales bacterium]
MTRILFFIFLLFLITSSCTVSREQFGNYNEMEGNATVYRQDKNFYLFWNLIPVKKIEKELELADYEIVVKRNFFDTIIFYGTIGIFSFYTVKIKIKELEVE